jgi:membrane protease YdiL (CAAX protease family)
MIYAGWIAGTALQAPGASSAGTVDLEQLAGVIIFYGALFLVGLAVNLYLLARFMREPLVWLRKINRLLWRPWSGADLLHTILVIVLLHLFVLSLLRIVHPVGWFDGIDDQYLWIVAHSLVLHWAALAVVWLRARRRALSWQVAFAHAGWSLSSDVARGLVAYVAAVPFLIFYAAVYHVWLYWTGHEPAPQDVVRLFAELDPGFMLVYFIFLALVVAPLAEEILFRGLLLPALGRRWGLGAAILVSSVLFAAMHFHIPSLVPLFVFSIALSLAYIYTESITVPVVMHMLFNAVSLMVMLYIG